MFDFQFLIVQNRSFEVLQLILLLLLIVIRVFLIDFLTEYFHDVSKKRIYSFDLTKNRGTIVSLTLINSSSFSLNIVK
jgi:hypothetical protein